MADFDGNDDFFDSRDVLERIEELEDIAVIDREPEDQEELDKLYEFKDEVGNDTEFEGGITFLAEDYFPAYAEEFVQDVYGSGVVLPDWVTRHIDWEEVAEELKVDYTTVELDGTTYYYR